MALTDENCFGLEIKTVLNSSNAYHYEKRKHCCRPLQVLIMRFSLCGCENLVSHTEGRTWAECIWRTW
jgi:hypothetical protein